MIPLERFSFLARLARCRISETETIHGEAQEKETSKIGKHRKNERGFPSLADPGSQERCHGVADSGPSGMPSSGCHLPVRMGVFRVFLGAHKNSKKEGLKTAQKGVLSFSDRKICGPEN